MKESQSLLEFWDEIFSKKNFIVDGDFQEKKVICVWFILLILILWTQNNIKYRPSLLKIKNNQKLNCTLTFVH